MDKLLKDFFRNRNSNSRGCHLKSWKEICKPKSTGGFELRRFSEANRALIAKLGRQIATGSNKFWVQLVFWKYLKGTPFPLCLLKAKSILHLEWNKIWDQEPQLEFEMTLGSSTPMWCDSFKPFPKQGAPNKSFGWLIWSVTVPSNRIQLPSMLSNYFDGATVLLLLTSNISIYHKLAPWTT